MTYTFSQVPTKSVPSTFSDVDHVKASAKRFWKEAMLDGIMKTSVGFRWVDVYNDRRANNMRRHKISIVAPTDTIFNQSLFDVFVGHMLACPNVARVDVVNPDRCPTSILHGHSNDADLDIIEIDICIHYLDPRFRRHKKP